jgi:uncharacterized protein YqjF (DUF2071 family)
MSIKPPGPFLTAEWLNLLMFNYAIDPKVLAPYVPHHTELDEWQGTHYVSLVGFLFKNTRVRGISIPFHRHFEEVNLRFYVRYKESGEWKRGVVFIREIVPRRMITLVANTLYGEKYATHRMSHRWHTPHEEKLSVEYRWRVGAEWNHLSAIASASAKPMTPRSEAEFITEHYWGYTQLTRDRTSEYNVSHPQWMIHDVESFDMKCSTARLYGEQFFEPLAQAPRSVFLATGSEISVMKGRELSSK